MDKRLARLKELSSEIGDIANSFAGNVTGAIAFELHSANNRMFNAIKMLENGIPKGTDERQMAEWFASQPLLMELMARQEHDVIMREVGSPNEGDGQEHSEIMREIGH
jgi:hypothetical protein